jgi:hypothetical protein
VSHADFEFIDAEGKSGGLTWIYGEDEVIERESMASQPGFAL